MHDQQSFATWSYELHEQHLQKALSNDDNPLERLTTLRGSIHDWRHERMYRMLEPLLDWGGRWLTVGDGIGTDANWLLRQQADAVATDICDTLLQQAHSKGFIREYRRENAEQLRLAENSFDFALCKEAYHHFPRPYMAVYEMLRVAKKAVVLIEPQDPIQHAPTLLFLKNLLDRLSPGLLRHVWKNQHSFEHIGNYVYKISEREIEKVAMGIGQPAVAFCGLNDYVQYHPEMRQVPPNRRFFRRVKFHIGFRNLLCRLGLMPSRLLFCIVFRETPPEQIVMALKKRGYRYIRLPKNPFLKAASNPRP